MPTVIQTNLPDITIRKSDISDAIKLSTKRDVVIIVERAHAIELIEAIKKEMEVWEFILNAAKTAYLVLIR